MEQGDIGVGERKYVKNRSPARYWLNIVIQREVGGNWTP